jgi:hypothetical protein
MMIVETKYNGKLELSFYMDYLINSVFRLLPMYEKNEDWKKYLTALQIELAGLEELSNNISFISLISRLEGLFSITDKPTFKKVVFDSISLIKQIKEGESYDIS